MASSRCTKSRTVRKMVDVHMKDVLNIAQLNRETGDYAIASSEACWPSPAVTDVYMETFESLPLFRDMEGGKSEDGKSKFGYASSLGSDFNSFTDHVSGNIDAAEYVEPAQYLDQDISDVIVDSSDIETWNIDSDSDVVASSDEDLSNILDHSASSDYQYPVSHELAEWAIEHNIDHVAINGLLRCLSKYHHILLKDDRTLLQTESR